MSNFPVYPIPSPYGASRGTDLTVRQLNAPQNETRSLAMIATQAPRVPWNKFIGQFDWHQGEHVALIGPTGQGKTTLLMHLLPVHPFVTVFATKPADDSMDRLIESDGYVKLERWRSLDPTEFPRRVLWPPATSLKSDRVQRAVFEDALEAIYHEGGWTVVIDELFYLINNLGLKSDVRTMLTQSRALKISMVCATQRPKFVPLEVYDQSTHLFFWRDNDKNNLERLSELNAQSSALVQRIVMNLEKFQVLYINTRTGEMLRTRAPAID